MQDDTCQNTANYVECSPNQKSLKDDKFSSELKMMIGPLTSQVRLGKVRSYLEKKRNKKYNKKVRYQCRKQVANQRLRIKGRFMTKQGALEYLGLTQDQLLANEDIQRLLT